VNTQTRDAIRVLIADDDERIVDCYREAFGAPEETEDTLALNALDAELFDDVDEEDSGPTFEIVICNQGQEAIDRVRGAAEGGKPFDVVILDVRMPPGIDGVEAGRQIRRIDADVEIVFVTGFSDVPREELERRVPPPKKLHYFNKPLSFMRLAHRVAGMVGTDRVGSG
jgi:CheY-like chemotaxis protein